MSSENYLQDGTNDAIETIRHFEDEIIVLMVDEGSAPTDMGDLSETWNHEQHTDRAYDLTEGAKVCDQLSSYLCDDSGLWEGQEPKDAIGTQAAFTYGYYVLAEFTRLMQEINEHYGDDVFDAQNEKEGDISDDDKRELAKAAIESIVDVQE